MTLLQDRPEAEAAEAPSPPVSAVGPETWLDTSDHKRLGLLFVYASLLFLVAGGIIGLIVGAQQTAPGLGLDADAWLRLYGLHTQMTVLLFLIPIWIGLAAYVVPLQIGAGRVALPRLLATGFWLYLVGGGMFVASFIVGPVNGGTIVSSTPVAAVGGGANAATNLWIMSLAVMSLAFLLALASLFTTIVALRSEGMTLLRVPAFSWWRHGGRRRCSSSPRRSSSVASCSSGSISTSAARCSPRPHGGACPSGSTRSGCTAGRTFTSSRWSPSARRLMSCPPTPGGRLLDHRLAVGALSVLGALSLTSLAASESVTRAVIVPTYTAVTALVVIPIGVMVLLWLGTTALGRPRFHVSLLYVVGSILLWALGAANVIAAAIRGVDGLKGNSAWIAGNAHAVVFGPPTLLAVGAIYHWGPKMWGRRLNPVMGSLAWLCLLVGFACSGMAYYLLGYNGAPLGLLADATSYQKGLYGLAEAGGALVALGASCSSSTWWSASWPAGAGWQVTTRTRASPLSGPPRRRRPGGDSTRCRRSAREAPLFYVRAAEAGSGPGAGALGSSGGPAAIEQGSVR